VRRKLRYLVTDEAGSGTVGLGEHLEPVPRCRRSGTLVARWAEHSGTVCGRAMPSGSRRCASRVVDGAVGGCTIRLSRWRCD